MSLDDSNTVYPDSYAEDASGSGHYPPLPPFPRIPIFTTGREEERRARYVQYTLEGVKRNGNLNLTPIEEEAYTYHHGTAYTHSIKGSIYGKLAGFTAGVLYGLRIRKPGPLVRQVCRRTTLSNRTQVALSRFNTAVLLFWIGGFYGFTSNTMSAAARFEAQAGKDPNMAKFNKQLYGPRPPPQQRQQLPQIPQRSPRGRSVDPGSQEQQGDDPQSLGGVDFYSSDNRDESAPNAEDRTPSYRNPPPVQVGKDDPFDIAGDSSQDRQPQRPTGSAWERLRRGERPNKTGGDESQNSSEEVQSRASSWRQRRQSKQDSFTFSDSDSERELAKTEAQKDFDQQVERERRGEAGDGFVADDSEGRRRR